MHETLDAQALRDLIDGDQGFACALVAEYALNSRQILAAMRELLTMGNRTALATHAHQLKGASANLHAHSLVAACEVIEQEAALASAAQITRHLEALAVEVERVNAELARFVAEGKPATQVN
jgi:HPt (histidine-containing phosphotransfer) domain-containing protein